MRRFTFAHAAGLHLDQPFSGIGRTPAHITSALCDAPLLAWDDLVEQCCRQRAAFLILSGGLHSGTDRGLRSQVRLRQGIKKLCDRGISVFVALNAEEAPLRECLQIDAPAKLTIFPHEQPTCATVSVDDTPIAALCGQSAHADAHLMPDRIATEAPPDLPVIGVLPCSAGALDEYSGDSSSRKLMYWALGGGASATRRGFAPWVVEPGTLQSRAAGTDHHGAKGAMFADAEGGNVVAVKLVELDWTRRCAISLAVGDPWDTAGVRSTLLDELNRLRAAQPSRALIVDITVELADAAACLSWPLSVRARLLDELHADTSYWDPFVWCASLNTTAASVLDDDSADEDLESALQQEGQALLANPLQRSVLFATRFEPLMKRLTQEMDNTDASRPIEDAAAIALQHLRKGATP